MRAWHLGLCRPRSERGTMFAMRLVAIGERDAAYACALARTIESEPGLAVAGHATTVAALMVMIAEHEPAVAVVDTRLPGDLRGLMDRAKRLGFDCRFVGLTTVMTRSGRRVARTTGFDVVVARGDANEVLAAITAAG